MALMMQGFAGEPRGLVLEPASLRPSLEATDSTPLPKHAVVRVVAQTMRPQPSSPPDEFTVGYHDYLVSWNGAQGWVSGEVLAVEGEGWVGETIHPFDAAGAQIWTATRTGWDWARSFEDWDREQLDGWLIRQRGDNVETYPLVQSNGWGSSQGVRSAIHRDFTGDGVDDRLLLVEESVTEVGSVGHTLLLLDPTRPTWEPAFSLPLHDPGFHGLDVVDRWGWAELSLPAKTLTHIYAERLPGEEKRELRRVEQSWSYATGELVPQGVSHTKLQATRNGAQGCIHRVKGPLGVGDDYEAEFGGCDRGPKRWVHASELVLADAPLDAALGPRWELPDGPLRVEWMP